MDKNEAIKIVKSHYPANKQMLNEALEFLIPELKENEDEKIKNFLMMIIDKYAGISIGEKKKCLAWLEKQGEIDKISYEIAEKEKREFVGNGFIKCYADFQDFKEGETYWFEYIGDDNYNVRSDNLLGKTYHITPCQLYTVFKKLTWLETQNNKPQGKSALDANKEEKVDNANKVEPNFHKRDWLCENEPNNYARFIQILEIVNIQGKEKYKISRDIYSDIDIVKFEFVEKYYHKFDTKDAKDGDILASYNDENPFIFKGCIDTDHPNAPVAYCGIDSTNKFHDCINTNNWWTDSLVHPAEKAQREFLFQKMKEAGYEWDSNKKELKRTAHN